MPPQAGSRATPSGLVCLAADKPGGWSLPERSDRSDAPDHRHVRSYLQRHVPPSPDRRRRGLYQASIHSKIALASWERVAQVWRSSSSTCSEEKKLSARALSKQSPTEPIEPRSPAPRRRCPNAHEVY